MNMRMKLAFASHFLASVLLFSFGIIYILRPEFMPYHSVAVGMTWAEVGHPFQVLILALMRGFGSACLSIAILMFTLLLLPFRRGVTWARWAIPIGGLIVSSGTLYATSYVALNTPATPPLIAPAGGAALLVVGFFLSWGQPRQRRINRRLYSGWRQRPERTSRCA